MYVCMHVWMYIHIHMHIHVVDIWVFSVVVYSTGGMYTIIGMNQTPVER